MTQEHKDKISRANKGRVFSKEHLRKLSEAQMGHIAWNRGKRVPQIQGKNNPNWKGDKATYGSKHDWVQRWYGTPSNCEHCQKGNLRGHKIHWANIINIYQRIRTDWIRLCVKCHKLYDMSKRRVAN